jgi:hypothetical protein
MSKADHYREILPTLDDWEPYLLTHSGLPGPRGNLELLQVVADLGDQAMFERFLSKHGPDTAPTNTPEEFLAACGIVGLGRLLAEGRLELLDVIRQHANDPRWRMHEGARMALQRWGERDMNALINALEAWIDGSPLEQRAVATALCDPKLLADQAITQRVLSILDRLTESVCQEADRRNDPFKALRKGLGHCWSIAVVALPEAGKPLMEKWLASDDKDVKWIMKQNLQKARLIRMDAEWVEHCRAQIAS